MCCSKASLSAPVYIQCSELKRLLKVIAEVYKPVATDLRIAGGIGVIAIENILDPRLRRDFARDWLCSALRVFINEYVSVEHMSMSLRNCV